MKVICSKCKIEKEITEFKKDKSKKLGRSSQCKECQKPYAKKYQKENLDKWHEYNKKWRKNNSDKQKEINKSWYLNNIEKHKQNMEEWRKANPNYMKEWYEENRKEYNKKRREKWANDHIFRLKGNIRTRIYHSIKNKNNASFKLLGCPIEEYIVYLEQQFDKNMTWENYGSYWEIDHIISLDKGGSFYYTNTQPLTISENRIKGNRLNG